MFKIIKNTLLVFFVGIAFLLNISSLSEDKDFHFKLRDSFFRCFGLSQRWGLFAPNPRFVNSYIAIVGELENGKMINLKTHEGFLPNNAFPPPKPPLGYNHLSYNLGYLGTFLFADEFIKFGDNLIKDIVNYETSRWYRQTSVRLKKIYFLQITVKTKSPGVFEPLEITTLKEVAV